MTIGIFEDASSDGISWALESTWVTPIEDGVYPAMFAIVEASETISNQVITSKRSVDTVADMVSVLENVIRHCIALGMLESAN